MVFGGDEDSVEKDENNNEPIEGLTLDHVTYLDPST